MTVKEYLLNNKQYGRRYETDVQFVDVTNMRNFSGTMNRNAKFIEENQLLNIEDWDLFVKQFEIV